MTWTRVGGIESDSEPGVMHDIKRRSGDGHLGCDCLSYRFAKGSAKTCKHVTAYLAGEAVDRRPVRQSVRPERVRVRSAGEWFTVTRAIAFGEISI